MRKKAFTITEMLVTISVTSLVIAVMVPVINSSRLQSRTITCLSNLRQLGIAAQLYANNNDGYYPIAYMYDPDPMDSTAVEVCWDFIWRENWDTKEESIEPGLVWQGETIDKVQQCPLFSGAANANNPYSGYNYNTSYIGHGSGEVVITPAREAEVKNPQGCALFGDGEYEGGANKFMRSPLKSQCDRFDFRWAGTQGYRHLGKTNVAWCDGHVSSQKEIYTETDRSSDKRKLDNYNKTAEVKIGFLSADNSAYDLE